MVFFTISHAFLVLNQEFGMSRVCKGFTMNRKPPIIAGNRRLIMCLLSYNR